MTGESQPPWYKAEWETPQIEYASNCDSKDILLPHEALSSEPGWQQPRLDSEGKAPPKPIPLRVYDSISFITVVASLRLMMTQLLPFILAPHSHRGLVELLLRLYIAFFLLIVCLVELDAPISFLRQSKLLQAYVPRGFLYSFLGWAAMELAKSEEVEEMLAHSREVFHVPWVALISQASSWPVIILGNVYMLLGFCCMSKRHKDSLKEVYEHRLKEYQRAVPERDNGIL